jgi:hypothetical protein
MDSIRRHSLPQWRNVDRLRNKKMTKENPEELIHLDDEVKLPHDKGTLRVQVDIQKDLLPASNAWALNHFLKEFENNLIEHAMGFNYK